MLFAVLFTDNEDRGEVRQRLMASHLAFLERHRQAIRAAGPLRNPASGDVRGGLWLVEASDEKAVGRLCEEDPFWPTGLRKEVRVLAWAQVFAEGKRLL